MKDKLYRRVSSLLRQSARLVLGNADGLSEPDRDFLTGLTYLYEQDLKRVSLLDSVLDAERIAVRASCAPGLPQAHLREARIRLNSAWHAVETDMLLALNLLEKAAWKHCQDSAQAVIQHADVAKFCIAEAKPDDIRCALNDLERTVAGLGTDNPKFAASARHPMAVLRTLSSEHGDRAKTPASKENKT